MKRVYVVGTLIILLSLLQPLIQSADGSSAAIVSARQTIIGLPDVFPASNANDAKAIIYRFDEADIILLNPSHAAPRTIAVGLSVLGRFSTQPVASGTTQVVVITGFVNRKPLSGAQNARFGQLVSGLMRAPVTQLGNLGAGRWIEL